MHTDNTAPEYLTIEEAASLLRVHAQTIRRMVWAGELAALRFGGRVIIPRTAIDAALVPVTPKRSDPAGQKAPGRVSTPRSVPTMHGKNPKKSKKSVEAAGIEPAA